MTLALPTLEESATWIVRFGRLGYIVEGIVYIVVGILATEASLGIGGATTDIKGAFREIGAAPFGIIALMVVGAGLFGYALWRIVSSITDAERRHGTPTSIMLRSADFVEGLVYGSFGIWVIRYLTRAHMDVADQTPHMTNQLMKLPLGRWIVIAAGFAVFGYALYQFYSAFARKYLDRLDLSGARRARPWIEKLGGFGVGARAAVFAMIGLLMVRAGIDFDPSRAGGIEKSLNVISNQPAGSIMFAIVATGLIAYGILQIVTARYRVMRAT
jgi:hypothetical protein